MPVPEVTVAEVNVAAEVNAEEEAGPVRRAAVVAAEPERWAAAELAGPERWVAAVPPSAAQ